MAGLNPDAKEWKPLNPGAPVWKPPFPDQPPQASPGLKTEWNWPRGTNPANNVMNPYSTTAFVKGKGKRKTRKAKKSKKRKTRRKMRK